MTALNLSDLRNIPGSTIHLPASRSKFNAPVRGISIDTRTLQPREIFWAIKGEKQDGHWYVRDAENQGAIAAVVDKKRLKQLPDLGIPLILVKDTLQSLQTFAAWHRNRFDIPVLAITGTNGKTTTKEMITWILQTTYRVHKTVGNLNNHIGLPLTLLNINSKHQVSVVELGTNHPGEISMLHKIAMPTAALITNIGRGHLQFFSNIDGVAQEKLSLFRELPRNGTIYLNRDDKKISSARLRRKSTWDYSLNARKKARVKGEVLGLTPGGMGIWQLNNSTKIQLRVPGTHNIQNALAASTVGLSFGINEKTIKSALEEYIAYDKRMQIIRHDHITLINDTYNANPDSFLPALETLNEIAKAAKGRKIVVIGDMLELGSTAVELHRDLFLRIASQKIDAVYTLGKFCRQAANHIRKQGFTHAYSFDNHEDLAHELKRFIKKGDIILFKGSRGMQIERTIGYL
ncbi:MAG: UDP-N-acetylmuramoyl-tripeptide--D-alanyl-D-alanine ligase [Calditrichales bacterium]|nr:MAG: UDP-N-acetylmuramoyl-tripeptide--D-alanyl-D-alanine ligase [Calditrichales bacterium]